MDRNPPNARWNRCNHLVEVVISGANVEAGLPEGVHLGPTGSKHDAVLLEDF
jgi:hypothetical protein